MYVSKLYICKWQEQRGNPRSWPSTKGVCAFFEWHVQHFLQNSHLRMLRQQFLHSPSHGRCHASLLRSPLWRIWSVLGQILWILMIERLERTKRKKAIPIWKFGDSIAALNSSKGTLEYYIRKVSTTSPDMTYLENTWSKTSRPFNSGDDGLPSTDGLFNSRISGRVTTRKWKTSSRIRWA